MKKDTDADRSHEAQEDRCKNKPSSFEYFHNGVMHKILSINEIGGQVDGIVDQLINNRAVRAFIKRHDGQAAGSKQ